VMGDATKATVEKGEQFLAAATEGLVKLVHELKGQGSASSRCRTRLRHRSGQLN
jgi:hypothetical protein